MIERKGYIYSGIGAKKNEEIAAKNTEKVGERLVDELVERLVENQKKILDLMKKDPYISKKELSLKVGISSTAIDKNIISLNRKGLLQRIGADRVGTGRWRSTCDSPISMYAIQVLSMLIINCS